MQVLAAIPLLVDITSTGAKRENVLGCPTPGKGHSCITVAEVRKSVIDRIYIKLDFLKKRIRP